MTYWQEQFQLRRFVCDTSVCNLYCKFGLECWTLKHNDKCNCSSLSSNRRTLRKAAGRPAQYFDDRLEQSEFDRDSWLDHCSSSSNNSKGNNQAIMDVYFFLIICLLGICNFRRKTIQKFLIVTTAIELLIYWSYQTIIFEYAQNLSITKPTVFYWVRWLVLSSELTFKITIRSIHYLLDTIYHIYASWTWVTTISGGST